MKTYHNLKSLLVLNSVNSEIIDYLIRTKHSYLGIVLNRDLRYIITKNSYKSVVYDLETSHITLSFLLNDEETSLSIDMRNEANDIIGFSDLDMIPELGGSDHTIFSEPLTYKDHEYKLIFSPQLAKWLIHHKYIVWDLKENKNKPNEVVFVFRVEQGFYEAIEEFKDQGKR